MLNRRSASTPPPDGPRHIAFVIAGLGAGGAERVLSLLSAAWVERGLRITVIAFDQDGDPIFHRLDERVGLIRLGRPPTARHPLRVLRRITALRRTLGAVRPDLTISFLTKINVLVLLASLGTRRRVIVSERNNPDAQDAAAIWNRLFAMLHARAAAIVMQTDASVRCLPPAARRQACVIGNPIAASAEVRAARDHHVLAAVGRLTRQKGFDLLVEAFARIADRHPDWRLRIWGGGEMRLALETLVAERDLERRVDLPGNSTEPGGWISGADAFVLSSRYEGFPNALGEAMAAGLPVAAFNCDFGPGSIIRDGVDGLLVEPEDVQALSAALDRLLGDRLLRAQLGAAASAGMRRFAPAKVVAQWDVLIAEIWANRRQ